MKRLVLILLIIPYLLHSQSEEKKTDRFNLSNFLVGGTFELNFGTNTYIYIAPELTYLITEDLHIGIGGSFGYVNQGLYIPSRIFKNYGIKLFGRYFLFEDFFVNAEYEKIYYRDNYINPGFDPINSYDGIYIGPGYRQWISNNSFSTISLLFDVTSDQYILGINPFLRFSVAFGF